MQQLIEKIVNFESMSKQQQAHVLNEIDELSFTSKATLCLEIAKIPGAKVPTMPDGFAEPIVESVIEPTKDSNINYIVMKRKIDPNTQTEVVIKLNGKTRHLFMTKPGEEEQEITEQFNPHDKRVFDNVFWKLKTHKL